jgi:hypothetical protein
VNELMRSDVVALLPKDKLDTASAEAIIALCFP